MSVDWQLRRMDRENSLLEENGSETGVESTDTLVLDNLAEARDETAGVGGLRDETDTGGLKGAEGDIGEELSGSGRGEVDSSSVLGGSLVAESVNPLLLEELVTTELQSTLEEVTGEGRADTSEESTSTLILDNLAETTNETAVVGSGVELDTGLDAVDFVVSLFFLLNSVRMYLLSIAFKVLSGKVADSGQSCPPPLAHHNTVLKQLTTKHSAQERLKHTHRRG